MPSLVIQNWSLTTVAVINAILAWVAACIHAWAAYKTSGHLRRMFLTIAGLATFYSFAYWWLVFNVDRSGDWSNFLRPFGLFTWVAAWALEPVILVRYLTRRGEQIVERAQVAADKAQVKLDE